MAYESKTPDALHEDMLASINDAIDKREGSVAHDLTYPTAIELGNTYVELDVALGMGFVDTSEGVYLERICLPFGITRKQALKAKGNVTLTGPAGTIVPINTRLQTTANEAVFFITLEAVTLTDGTATVSAEAELGGAQGNVGIGEINALAPGDLYGIVSVTNATAFDGGVDVEDDESLRKRLIDRAQNPATSGNANHYRQWALEIAGVGDAKVKPIWNGAGTVKVILLDTEKTAPTQPIIDSVTAHINEQKPIGATVTVVGASEVGINITATLTLEEGAQTESITSAFKVALTDYLKTIAFADSTVRYAKIASLLIDVAGVLDYANLKVNGATNNVPITDEQVAIAGTVTFT